MLSAIVGGGGGGIGNMGAAIGAAATASGVAAGMMMASATHAAGGASAIKAAYDAAQGSMEVGQAMFGEGGQGGDSSSGGSGGLGQAMNTGVRFAADMGSHLAKGTMQATKDKFAGDGNRASQTPGGKVASAIRANMEQPVFKGNVFANSTETKVDAEAEAAAWNAWPGPPTASSAG